MGKKKKDDNLKSIRKFLETDGLERGGVLYNAFNFLVDLGVADDIRDVVKVKKDEVVVYGHKLPIDIFETDDISESFELSLIVAREILSKLKIPRDISRLNSNLAALAVKLTQAGFNPVFKSGLILPYENSPVGIELFFTEENNKVHGLEVTMFFLTFKDTENFMSLKVIEADDHYLAAQEEVLNKIVSIVREKSTTAHEVTA